MTDELGAFALLLALALSAVQTAASAAARIRHDATLRGAGEGAALGAFVAIAIAFFALMHAFVTSDFSVMNVAANSHTDKPLLYKVAAVWGSHEGSMMLWCLALTGFGAAVAVLGSNLPSGLKALTVATQGALGLLFIGYTAFASNPFVRLLDAPVQGASLNPILQDPFLAIHPPFLYSGYVGFSVVFSFAVAALIEGRVDAAWARWVRPWTLAAWSCLTVGITLGSFWAYYELGWGGWWFWDPVENASFMPWLIGTALLHSAIVTEKRGALAGWTVFLAISAFTFSMLGAFLVRSGVLTSVHAFAVDPKRGVILLGILGFAAGTAFALFAWRAPALKGEGGLFAPVSREGALVLNNLFLAAATLTVMLGTLYPLIRQALTGEAISVGSPYFALTFAPLMGACLLILPAGPLMAWKRGDALGAAQRLWAAAALALLAALVGYFLLQPGKLFVAVGLAIGTWLIVGSLVELSTRVKTGAAPVRETLRRLAALPRAQWGMTLAHAGLGVFVLGASFETAGRIDAAEALGVGQSLHVGAYILTLKSVAPSEGPNYSAERAVLSVSGPGGAAAPDVTPERRFYPANRQTTSQVAIQRHGASDLYVVLGEQRDGSRPSWLVRAYWNPWARFIFGGPILMALGGLISLSDRRLRLAAGARRKFSSPPPLRRGGKVGLLLPRLRGRGPIRRMVEGVRLGATLAAALLLIAAASNDPADRLPKPQQEARARALFRDIRCLVCQNQSIDESDADLAEDLRKIVRGQVAEGQTNAEIKRYLVDRYGEFVLERPSFSFGNALLWGAPFALVIVGGAVMVLRRRKTAVQEAPLTPEEEAKLTAISSHLS